jgi:hypothetical protein
MEHLEMQERVINLGKALVQELGLEPSVDTLARWMAHYIAEQIVTAENSTGDAKIKAQQQCFETILTLWQHRSALPDGHRPFENFEPIFRALERLDPDNPRPFYYRHETDDELELTEVKQWIDLAIRTDNAAKVLINFAFTQAAQNATDDKTISWLNNSANLTHGDGISFAIRFLSEDLKNQHEDTLNQVKADQIKQLKSKIEKLDAFLELSKSIRLMLIDNIKQLS